MKIIFSKLPLRNTLSIVFAISLLSSCVDQNTLNVGDWNVEFDRTTKSVDVSKNNHLIFNNLYASYKMGSEIFETQDYDTYKIYTASIDDKVGEGMSFNIEYTKEGLPTMVHSIYLYKDKDFFLTDFSLKEKNSISSNYMSPFNLDKMPSIFPNNSNNRALFVPFDNDCWIRYKSHQLTFNELTSYEVTAVFDNDSRKGVVLGSVEHDLWKTGIKMHASKTFNLSSVSCFGGIADQITRDSKAHGNISGSLIKSPKIFVGYFEDWRVGMEDYADVNAAIAPPKEWNKSVPFGWNSWGALQFNLNYDKAIEVSDFHKEFLQDRNFKNSDNLLYIGLDSGWNSFTEEQLKSFADKCKENGQIPGIYWTPFTDWGKDPERVIDVMPEYKYKDLYLYVDGKPQELDGAYAIDPTHPAVEAMMKSISDLFRRTGFEYVKMDFMTHGAMESDLWYNKDIQTGIQGYNYGMKLIDKYFGDMYLNLSISPIFPAQYAQSRRIACDAWNKMKDTEYTMNAMSYGWWQDRIYQFNDPDHIVLRDATDGENRARVTSGVITGMLIGGDDFSKDGPEEAKVKARKYLTNSEINSIANGIAFRPVEGNGAMSENQFVRVDDNGNAYYVVFNYTNAAINVDANISRLGLDSAKYTTVKELWSGKKYAVKQNINFTVAPLDVAVMKFN